MQSKATRPLKHIPTATQVPRRNNTKTKKSGSSTEESLETNRTRTRVHARATRTHQHAGSSPDQLCLPAMPASDDTYSFQRQVRVNYKNGVTRNHLLPLPRVMQRETKTPKRKWRLGAGRWRERERERERLDTLMTCCRR